MIAILELYIWGYLGLSCAVCKLFSSKITLLFPQKSHERALKLTELWTTSLLFDLNYKFINGSNLQKLQNSGLKQCMLCNLGPFTLKRFRCHEKKSASIDPRPHYRFDAFSTFHDTRTFENDTIRRCDISWTPCTCYFATLL